MTTTSDVALVVTAAGNSSRFRQGKKEFAKIGGKAVLGLCLENFLRAFGFSKIVVTVPKNGEKAAKAAAFSSEIVRNFFRRKENLQKIAFVEGGETRQKSVFNALSFLTGFHPQTVLIHDGARPWVSQDVILDAVEKVRLFGAACPVLSSVDTPKICAEGKIERHLARKTVFLAQTPQAFDFERIFRAHKKAAETRREWTDDSEIFAEFEGEVFASKGDAKNRKITFLQDLKMEKTFRVERRREKSENHFFAGSENGKNFSRRARLRLASFDRRTRLDFGRRQNSFGKRRGRPFRR